MHYSEEIYNLNQMIMDTFNGPLFIVGMPRSGTKLIRDLLNNHPAIFIPSIESKIIPYLAKKYGLKFRRDRMDEFLTDWYDSSFHQRMSRVDSTVGNREWLEDYQQCELINLSDIIEDYFRILSKRVDASIWGEKTPTYLRHYVLLMRMYPDAKFVHIVRDPRDYCLSNRKTWGKSEIRAASRWNESITGFIKSIHTNNVIHITYENLTKEPVSVLQDVCEFLGLNYHRSMNQLASPSESVGEAKGLHFIKVDNTAKWLEKMSVKRVKRIERLCADMMIFFDYESMYYSGKSVKAWALELQCLKVLDGINLMRFYLKLYGGIIPAFRFMLKEYRRKVQ